MTILQYRNFVSLLRRTIVRVIFVIIKCSIEDGLKVKVVRVI